MGSMCHIVSASYGSSNGIGEIRAKPSRKLSTFPTALITIQPSQILNELESGSMLTSMTGIGRATSSTEQISMSVEIKTVNNRFFKLSHRLPEQLQPFEAEIEKKLRQCISRGSVNLNIRCETKWIDEKGMIDTEVLDRYLSEINELSASRHLPPPTDWNSLLSLPGVISQSRFSSELSTEQQTALKELLFQTLTEALGKLNEFRSQEGASMASVLKQCLQEIQEQHHVVAARVPEVVVDYRNRLLERVKELLSESEASVNENDLIREVSVYSERCDVHEELTRLDSHLEQFHKQIEANSSDGRKLDFLCQEMFREINTIGSKGNDVAIAHAVVEMKSVVEKIRELVQNIE